MAKLTILEFPDERLRKVARPVDEFDDKLAVLIDDMFETMYEAPGIGLAATQVNVHQQLIVMDISEAKNEPLVLINPKILEQHGEQVYKEGCLSVPEIFAEVRRAESLRMSYHDREGMAQEMAADGLLAVCIQHEMDHLAGKVFVDYLSVLKRQMVISKMKKRAKQKLLDEAEAAGA